MTVTLNAPLYVEAPPGEPRRFGILDTARVIDDSSGHWQMGVQYQSPPCYPPGVTGSACFSTAPQLGPSPNAFANSPTELAFQWSCGDSKSQVGFSWSGVNGGAPQLSPCQGGNQVLDQTIDFANYGVTTGRQTVVLWTQASAGALRVFGEVQVDLPMTPPENFPINGSQTTNANKSVTPPFTLRDGAAFVVYALVDCNAVGSTEMLSVARDLVTKGASQAIENLFPQILADQDLLDLSSGTTRDPVEALAQLEGLAAQSMAWQPTFHAPPTIATVLAHRRVVDRYGDRLETVLGSRVSVGNYPESDYLYMTGPVTITRGPLMTTEVVDPVSNLRRALVEQPYLLIADCEQIKMHVTTKACCP